MTPIELAELHAKIANLRVEYEKLKTRIFDMRARMERGPKINPGYEIQFKNTSLRFARVKGELYLAEQQLSEQQHE